jgi:Mn-dependent DtxR family transcriptional regulator
MRALGKTRVNTAEIARALGLSVPLVNVVVKRLEDKGVKLT